MHLLNWNEKKKGGPEAGPPVSAVKVLLDRGGGLGRWGHVDNAASPLGAEFDMPFDEREQRVVAAAPHTVTWMEVGATLADDDLARIHQLPTESLDAKPLRVRITAVPGGRRALLVCHQSALALDPGDPDLGVALAVTLTLPVSGLVLVLENSNLLALRLRQHFSGDRGRA
jgi:hypothetical protein